MERIKEDDLAKGMLPPVIISTIVAMDDTDEHVVLKGGDHPRMRFVDDATFQKSFSACLAFTTDDAAITLKKGAGRVTVAVTAAGLTAAGITERFTRTAGAAGIDEDKVTIFEVEDDVVIVGAGGANAATFALVQVYFERID